MHKKLGYSLQIILMIQIPEHILVMKLEIIIKREKMKKEEFLKIILLGNK